MFVSEDGLGRMRLDATGAGDILVVVPVPGVDPKSAVFTGKLQTVGGKTTFQDVNRADCSLTLVGTQDSIKVTDETATCKFMDSDGLLLRTFIHEKADDLKGDYNRIQDDTSASSEAITLSVLTSGDSGFTFSVSAGGKPSLTGKTATIVDSGDLVWTDGKPGGCTLGFVLLAPNRIVVESEDNCVDDQGTPHNYLGSYTRSAP
jgi:hypothetical protein